MHCQPPSREAAPLSSPHFLSENGGMKGGRVLIAKTDSEFLRSLVWLRWIEG
jgi:hypothetical protein